MKRLQMITLMAVLLFLLSIIVYAQEKYGLIIVAYGSPMPQWNEPVLKLENEIKTIMIQKGNNQFSAIRVALMEFREPSITTVIYCTRSCPSPSLHHWCRNFRRCAANFRHLKSA